MRILRLACAAASVLLAVPLSRGHGPAAAAESVASCRAGPAWTDRIAEVGPRGEIRLASGARVLLDSLHWPAEPVAGAARSWLEARRGRDLTVVPRGTPDRWGRQRADIVSDIVPDGLPEGTEPDLAGGLAAAGLAAIDPGEADALCRPALLRVEAGARARRLGLWQVPLPEARDAAALRALEGRFVVVEGVVRHVGERSARTYLDFVRRGEDGLTVTVSKRTWRRVLEHGLSAAGLTGRRVRVRGILEIRRGPVIDVTVPELVEPLDGTEDGRRGADSGHAEGRGTGRDR
ncbi:pentapeptide repeat-containing protein [Methylobacterium radiodurans]|uniref:pentapeptide repeat-containing protein n=1 Tax=Methylobacterium radiodurans TaxID=2202828 RepID=UPI001950F04B|nr:pentapeptide repeat-containing protein [Methylobacterium radiodurans]